MHCLPILTTGQERLHSWLHLLGLHLSVFTTAIRVNLSLPPSVFLSRFPIVIAHYFTEEVIVITCY